MTFYTRDILISVFRFYVKSPFALFGLLFFRPLAIQQVISTFWYFVQISFRTLHISVLCHFDHMLFRPLGFLRSHFELWTFRTNVISTFQISVLGYSTHGLFEFISFRPSDFSILCYFNLRTFLSFVISTFGHFNKSHFQFWTFRTYVISKWNFRISTHWLFDSMLFRH